MRNTYIVTYDICDPRRLRQVFKLMRGWGNHLQLSVFECELNAAELVELKGKLAQEIHQTQDQVLFANLGPAGGRGHRAITSLGLPYVRDDAVALIV